jgi:plastocyanin
MPELPHVLMPKRLPKRLRTAGVAGAAILSLAAVTAGCGSTSAATRSSSSSSSSSSAYAPAPSSSAYGAASSSSASASSQTAPSGSASGASRGSHAVTVAIRNFAYAPQTLTVSPGTRVTWVNHDSTAHTATVTGGFDTGTIAPGRSASVVLSRPGTYHYHCLFHAFMLGTIVVR